MSADTLKLLMESGLTGDDLIAVVRAFDRDMESLRVGHTANDAAEKRRAYDRERKRKQRMSADIPPDNSTGHSTGIPPDTRARVEDNPSRLVDTGKDNTPLIPPRGAKRGTRIPDDWQPDLEAVEGLSPSEAAREFAKFRDYWLAVPGQRGVKLDWQATWRNWCRNAVDRRQSRGTDPPKRGSAALVEALERGFSP